MKRNILRLIAAITVLIFFAPSISAQEENVEKKVEKRMKIVKVDEKGNKTVIDTIIKGDIEDLHLDEDMKIIITEKGGTKEWTTKEGNIIIMSSDDENEFTFHSRDGNEEAGEKGKVIIMKKGDGEVFSVHKSSKEHGDIVKYITIDVDKDMVHTKDGNIIMKSGSEDGHSYIVTVDEVGDDQLKWIYEEEDIGEGETHLSIRTKNEVQDIIIKGDAVITIKDGKINYKGDAVKMDIKKKGDSKVVKEKEVKKEIKKK